MSTLFASRVLHNLHAKLSARIADETAVAFDQKFHVPSTLLAPPTALITITHGPLLKAWTVRTKNGKFYAQPTYHSGQVIGPFKNLQATAQAISRRLAEEFISRTQRLEKFDANQHRKNARAQRRIQDGRSARPRPHHGNGRHP